MSALSVMITENASGAYVISRIQKMYSICVCVTQEGEWLLSPETDAEYLMFMSVVHKSHEYSLIFLFGVRS